MTLEAVQVTSYFTFILSWIKSKSFAMGAIMSHARKSAYVASRKGEPLRVETNALYHPIEVCWVHIPRFENDREIGGRQYVNKASTGTPFLRHFSVRES